MKIWYAELDVLKAGAILLIVFCHLDNYVSCYDLIRIFDGYAAMIGLSIFFFVSGFLLAQHDSYINSIYDIKNFYWKKFIRIFPLYWLALASLVIIFGLLQVNPGHVSPYNFDLNNLFLHFLGLQGIFPYYNIQSMWFVGVIILFYLLYPMIMYLSKNTKYLILISFVIQISFIFFHASLGLIHFNAIFYFPVFISGILVNRIIYSSKTISYDDKIARILILNIALGVIIILLLVFGKFDRINKQYISLLLTYIFLIPFSISSVLFTHIYVKKISGKILKVFSSIAFGTYAIYLFQHQFLAIFSMITNSIVRNVIYQDIIILTIGFAGAIICGIVIQTIEHRIFQRAKSLTRR